MSSDPIAEMCAALGSEPEALRAWGLARADAIVRELPADSMLARLLEGRDGGEVVEIAPAVAPTAVEREVGVEEVEEVEEIEEIDIEIDDDDDDEAEVVAETAPSPEPVFQRRHERFALNEPVTVSVASWPQLVELQADDISQGGMFVRAEEPPRRGERATITIGLPEGGSLELEGEVVHVVEPRAGGPRPGFGVQFVGLSAERKNALREIVRHAMSNSMLEGTTVQTLQELGFTPSASGTYRMSMTKEETALHDQLRARLQQMRTETDLQVLGLEVGFSDVALHDAYFSMAEAWHPDIAARYGAPEIKRLVTEIFLCINRAYESLRHRAPEPNSAVIRLALAGTRNPPVLARRLAGSLGQIRAQREGIEPVRASPPKSSSPSVTRPPPPKKKDPRVSEAIDRMANKDFEGATRVLASLPLDNPTHRVLHEFAHARLALQNKDPAEACRHYRAILAIQPENPTAQRELVLVEAMVHARR